MKIFLLCVLQTNDPKKGCIFMKV